MFFQLLAEQYFNCVFRQPMTGPSTHTVFTLDSSLVGMVLCCGKGWGLACNAQITSHTEQINSRNKRIEYGFVERGGWCRRRDGEWRERGRKTRWGVSGEIVGGWVVFGGWKRSVIGRRLGGEGRRDRRQSLGGFTRLARK